jgi:hypothetical protein
MISTDDKMAIHELIARFCHCSDYGDWDGLRGMFTEDAVTEIDGGDMKFTGVEAQVEHARASEEQTEGKNRHYYFNIVISKDGEAVYADYMMINVNAGHVPMSSQIVVTGRHRDRFVETGDGWKFAHRYVTFDQSVKMTF